MQPTSSTSENAPRIQHFDHVPEFVGVEMDRLHGSLFSSLSTMAAYGDVGDGLKTYAMSVDGVLSQILMYRINGRTVRVANEGIKLGSRDMQQFCDFVFSTYPTVSKIVFHAIEKESGTDSGKAPILRFPLLRHNCLEDMIIPIPKDVDTYFGSLGKSTRRTIKSYTGKIKKDHPSFRIEVKEGQEIDEGDIDAIIRYHRMRMEKVGKPSSIDSLEERRIRDMAHSKGLVCTMRIEGQIIGGTINYRIGDNFFGYVHGYDAEYERYRAGFMLYYVTICECIRLGGKVMNLMWGRYPYKFMLGAHVRELDHITIYRSYMQLLLHAKGALADASKGWKRQAGLWVRHELMEKNNRLASVLRRASSVMRDTSSIE